MGKASLSLICGESSDGGARPKRVKRFVSRNMVMVRVRSLVRLCLFGRGFGRCNNSQKIEN